MSTTTATPQSPPEFKSLHRVASIPFIADSMNAIHSSLLANTLTRTPYNASLSIGGSVYSLSQPIQARLAPVLLKADGFANKGLDAVETRYPYPFQTPTEELYKNIRAVPDHAVGVANKTATDFAHELDQRLTPLVNRYESVLTRFSHSTPSSSSSSEISESSDGTSAVNDRAQSQVERAYRLTLDLRNQIYSLSSEQLKHLQTPGAVVQKVTEVVYDLNTQIANSYVNVKGKGVSIRNQTQATVHALAQAIVQELEKIQATTAALPEHLHASLKPAQDHISNTITTITTIIKSPDPLAQKATRIKETVQGEVQPLLEATLDTVHNYVEASRKYIAKEGKKAEEKVHKASNGKNTH